MPSFLTLTYKDSASQKANMRLQTRDISAANIDAIQTEFSALRTALEPFTLGNLNQYEIIADRVVPSQGAAAGSAARRELKLLLTYEDSVTHVLYSTELPAPEVTNDALWLSGDKEFADTTTASWTALKTAFETVVRSPDLNSVILKTGKIVGRNL